jgi:hypothetical protein
MLGQPTFFPPHVDNFCYEKNDKEKKSKMQKYCSMKKNFPEKNFLSTPYPHFLLLCGSGERYASGE